MNTEPPYYSHPNSELNIDVSESPNEEAESSNEEDESSNEEDESSNEEDPPHPHSCTCQPDSKCKWVGCDHDVFMCKDHLMQHIRNHFPTEHDSKPQ
ncbi:hypothetical protein N7471_010762 [Penicillium samsonianum]|uniref:uncharacterized protein n=1 Tax=Penicillium samsonianum TaxID=1882272 RepID=UPI002548A31A|nr:uncharacterized protein N7471_010660 [Penicillium samsonianum]XP_057132460.1 uncharacterized protein N7471_010762 [Penicillium samsonianum]KAJ6126167.1 hypothetical protein N7471_010660 [Penicillium samsonianum]KAJ6126269.1 hypothetical protein N7471_010762 [Penicillium samsonianum]